MKTTEKGKNLHKWLTDTYDGAETRGYRDTEVNLHSGLVLLPRGFKDVDLKKGVTGSDLVSPNLGTLVPQLKKLMKAFFLFNPWQPGKAGDMVAFLKGLGGKLSDAEFKSAFENKVMAKYSGVDSEELINKLQVVNGHLGELTTKISTINGEIYQGVSKDHVGTYVELLRKMIVTDGTTGLNSNLAMMKSTSIDKWDDTGKKEDSDPSESRFQYGFKGIVTNKDQMKATIDNLTKADSGSLQQLSTALTRQSQSDDDDVEDNLTAEHSPQSSSDSSSGGIAGGLLGTTALLGGGGGAYAFNLFGFGDFMRSLFRGPGITNLRG